MTSSSTMYSLNNINQRDYHRLVRVAKLDKVFQVHTTGNTASIIIEATMNAKDLVSLLLQNCDYPGQIELTQIGD